jgi:antitoxin (DNA-binding transcriptional repressor) of toxin-antitoxin stability system
LYTTVHFIDMKLSISEARKRLPELVRHVRKVAGATIEITVRDEVVAELRARIAGAGAGSRRQEARSIDASALEIPGTKNEGIRTY